MRSAAGAQVVKRAHGWTIGLLSMLCLLLASCGSPSGAGSGGGEGPSTRKILQISLNLLDSSGNPTTSVAAGGSARIELSASIRTIVSNNGRTTSDTTAAANGLIIDLSSEGASFDPSSGRVLTGNDGRAVATLLAGNSTGAQVLSAQASTTDTGSAAVSLNYQIVRTSEPLITLSLVDASAQLTNTLRAGQTISVRALVEDVVYGADGSITSRSPRSGAAVTFTSDGGLFDPASGTALSDGSGLARVSFQAGVSTGVFNMTASASLSGATRSASTAYQVSAPQLLLGSGSPFVAGRLSAPAGGSVRAGEPVLLQGEVRTADGALFTIPVDVNFTSSCASVGSATLPASARSSNGIVTAQYTAGAGCAGQDIVSAEALLPSQVLGAEASITLNVLPPSPTTIRYLDSDAQQLGLLGRSSAGRPDRATLRFQVSNNQGVAAPGASVSFAVTSNAGGIGLLSSSAISDQLGVASVTVLSGSRATSFRVIATLLSQGVSAQSEVITISTGTPDQESFSAAVSTFNIEGWNFDGVETSLTLRAGDFFNNPIADGSRAFLTTEGGAVDPVCTFAGGVCTVTLRSQNPRPSDGRLSVLMTVPGDESFVDLNGNGQFDSGEPFDDLAEAFRDDNEDGIYQSTEPFSDRNGNGVRDLGNGLYDGILCGSSGGCVNNSSVDVRAQRVLVFSTSPASIVVTPSVISVDELTPQLIEILISDQNGNLPPAGSTIEISSTNGILLTPGNFEVGNSNARGPLRLLAQIVGDGQASSGILNINLTTPLEITTNRQISVNDFSICDSLPAPLPPGCDSGDVEIGSLTVTPLDVIVQPNDTDRVVNLSVGVFAGSGSTARPYFGITPTIVCLPNQGANGMVITPAATYSATNSGGQTTIPVTINATALPSGTVTCTVRAGEQSESTIFRAAPLTVSQLVLNPTDFAVTANQSDLTLNLQVVLLADAGGGATVPVAGVIPQVTSCSQGSASGFFVLQPAPEAIQPTNSQGLSVLAFVANSGATPSGVYSCTIAAGSLTATVTFTGQ
ncbi:Ig-like domain-containing protein [Pseudomarimonas arenosa]|uniref:Ig-like domain-containing protein n=1 Tax=Pseudomarimonas arenosa TaxID=2774145 RepID=A0AAW3ZKM9_9GAMM|nr:Ig-like domain-containing protein [Pseudomarimonas arenosa]MBD8525995.1 Ig-like domain-containing protein [Pseudomarimonas arenosa]